MKKTVLIEFCELIKFLTLENVKNIEANFFFLSLFFWLGHLLPHIPWIEQGGSILLVTLLYDLFDGLTILS